MTIKYTPFIFEHKFSLSIYTRPPSRLRPEWEEFNSHATIFLLKISFNIIFSPNISSTKWSLPHIIAVKILYIFLSSSTRAMHPIHLI